MRRSSAPTGVGLLLGILITWGLLSMGLWWVSFILSAVWAWMVSPRRVQFGGAILMSLVGYSIALAWVQRPSALGTEARVAAEIMGFGPHGALIFLLTALLAVLLSLAGAWLGRALRFTLHPPKPRYRGRYQDWIS